MAPEETLMGEKLFESAFAQLPVLIEEWKKQLGAELAELVSIPLHLCSQGAPSRWVVASSNSAGAEPHKTGLDKLHLACAVFRTAGSTSTLYTHSEVFLTSVLDQIYPHLELDDDVLVRGQSFSDRFRIGFPAEAPYIIHACGLDPSVAYDSR